MSKLTRRHNDPLGSVVSGNHIAADLSQSLAEQIRPSVDLAAKVSSGFSATPAIANMSALSQVWRKSLLPAQSSIADMIKGLTSAGSMPKPSDQLAAAMPSSIMPELYRGGFAARFAKVYDAGSTSKQAIKALAKVDMPPLTPTTTVPKFDRIYFTPAIDFASLFADTVPVADLVSELRSNTSDIFEGTRQHRIIRISAHGREPDSYQIRQVVGFISTYHHGWRGRLVAAGGDQSVAATLVVHCRVAGRRLPVCDVQLPPAGARRGDGRCDRQ